MFFALQHPVGGGTVCFNPNLYSNGKVCLSLSGTQAMSDFCLCKFKSAEVGNLARWDHVP